MRRLLAAFAAALFPLAALAQVSSVQAAPGGSAWLLSAGEMSYMVGINELRYPQTLYWGPRIASIAGLPPAKMHGEIASQEPPIATTPLEYAAWSSGGLPYEPAPATGP